MLNTPYFAEHTLAVAAYILIMLGLSGAYILQAERSEIPGFMGSLLALIGSA
jgi:hypothetical protein